MNHLIVNADDFGYSEGINRGIIEAHAKGIVTSTSLMVGGVAAREVARLRDYPDLSVGLHLTLEGSPNINLTPAEIEAEFQKQLDLFTELTGHDPTHVDTHKTSPHKNKVIEQILLAYSRASSVPIRGLGFAKLIESFFGLNIDGTGTPDPAKISPEALKKSLTEATDEFNEIFCHPGYSDDYLRSHSSYNDFRETELKTLTDPSLKEYIEHQGFQLSGWAAVKDAMR